MRVTHERESLKTLKRQGHSRESLKGHSKERVTQETRETYEVATYI